MINLSSVFRKFGNKKVLENVNLDLTDGSKICCILGKSGSGKTTLLNILYGLDQEYLGEYLLFGEDTKSFSAKKWDSIRKENMRIVYQDFKLLDFFSVWDNIKYSLDSEFDDHEIQNVMNILDIQHISNSLVKDISGGEKQRVAFARAIISNPKILLLDEPTDNLDEENTKKLLNYIHSIKKDKLIIIVTHDNRVLDYADVIYNMEDGIVIENDVQGNETFEKKALASVTSSSHDAKKRSFKKVLRYSWKSLKARVVDILMINIPIIFVFAVFIVAVNAIKMNSVESMNTFFSGVSENVIVLNASNYNQEYIKKLKADKVVPSDDGTRIRFSETDLKNVQAIKGVKEARLFNSSNQYRGDLDKNILNQVIEAKDYPASLKAMPIYSSIPDSINLDFVTMNVPKAYAMDYNKGGIRLVAGALPEDNTEEILISNILLDSIVEHVDATFEIGKNLKLNVLDNDKVTRRTKAYRVSGVYETSNDMLTKQTLPIYMGYMEFDFLDSVLTEEAYQSYKTSIMNINANNRNYENPLLVNYDTYVQAIGTNLEDLIVKLDKPSDVEEVTAALKNLFPNYAQLSQYDYKNGELSHTYASLLKGFYAFLLIAITIVALVIFFLNKSYIRKRSKEMATLYSLGYSSSSVRLIIVFEYLIVTAINIAISALILYCAYLVYFRSMNFGRVFEYAAQSKQMLFIALFLMLTTYITILASLYSIKKNKLVKYLKGN